LNTATSNGASFAKAPQRAQRVEVVVEDGDLHRSPVAVARISNSSRKRLATLTTPATDGGLDTQIAQVQVQPAARRQLARLAHDLERDFHGPRAAAQRQRPGHDELGARPVFRLVLTDDERKAISG
jgi:nitrogen-specific signal transduction histidine kinase